MRVTLLFLCALVAHACGEEPPANTLRFSGHVEATEVRVGAEVGGRLTDLRVEEGDRLHRGDIVGQLDSEDTRLQLERVRAERGSADAQLRLLLAGARPEDIRQAEAEVRSAETEEGAARAELESAQLDLQRFESLLAA